MTAIKGLDRQEATALWRSGPQAQRKEVVVSIGKSTLILSDFNDVPLAHWSLATLHLQYKSGAWVYASDPSFSETLELTDREMFQSIEAIRGSFRSKKPRKGRLRLGLSFLIFVTILFLTFRWFPTVLARHASDITPKVLELEIGHNILSEVETFSGRVCQGDEGQNALQMMVDRLSPDQGFRLYIADIGARSSLQLPGPIYVLHRRLIEEYGAPEPAAGFLIEEMTRRKNKVPLEEFFLRSGVWATLSYLTSGQTRSIDLENYALFKMTTPPPPIADDQLILAFNEMKIPIAPYADAKDPSGKSVSGLLEAARRASTHIDILPDQEWIALQSICEFF